VCLAFAPRHAPFLCHVERSETSLIVALYATETNNQRFLAMLRMTKGLYLGHADLGSTIAGSTNT
jgi:hypothetical protein